MNGLLVLSRDQQGAGTPKNNGSPVLLKFKNEYTLPVLRFILEHPEGSSIRQVHRGLSCANRTNPNHTRKRWAIFDVLETLVLVGWINKERWYFFPNQKTEEVLSS